MDVAGRHNSWPILYLAGMNRFILVIAVLIGDQARAVFELVVFGRSFWIVVVIAPRDGLPDIDVMARGFFLSNGPHRSLTSSTFPVQAARNLDDTERLRDRRALGYYLRSALILSGRTWQGFPSCSVIAIPRRVRRWWRRIFILTRTIAEPRPNPPVRTRSF